MDVSFAVYTLSVICNKEKMLPNVLFEEAMPWCPHLTCFQTKLQKYKWRNVTMGL